MATLRENIFTRLYWFAFWIWHELGDLQRLKDAKAAAAACLNPV